MEDKKQADVFELVEVPTQTALMIKDPEGNVMSESQALVYLLNELRKLNKRIG